MGNNLNCCDQRNGRNPEEDEISIQRQPSEVNFYRSQPRTRSPVRADNKILYNPKDTIDEDFQTKNEPERELIKPKEQKTRVYTDPEIEEIKKIQNAAKVRNANKTLKSEIKKNKELSMKRLLEEGSLITDRKIEDFYAQRVKEVENNLAYRNGAFESKYIPEYLFTFDSLKEEKTRNTIYFQSPLIYLDKNKKEVYQGYLDQDLKPHVWGIKVFNDGSKYEGEYEHGRPAGRGKYIKENGNLSSGYYSNGKLNEKGVFVSYYGTIYVGEWEENQINGAGEEFFKDGSHYKGTFKNGKKAGRGCFVWADGSTYDGEVENNLLHGFGTYIWKDDKEYVGQWKDNMMHGEGKMSYPDGTSYEGGFVQNKRSGFGKFIWNENKWYEGEWKDNRQNGDGKFYKSGVLVLGEWKRGSVERIVEQRND